MPASYSESSVITLFGLRHDLQYSERLSAESEATIFVELNIDNILSPVNVWVTQGSVQPFLFSAYRMDSTGIQTFYENGAGKVEVPKDTTLCWIITDPLGNRDTISFKHDLTRVNDEHAPVIARGAYKRTAEFPHCTVTFTFNDFDATLVNGAWNEFAAKGNIVVERN